MTSVVTPNQMAKLYFYYAAMNAGKSTTLLQADFNYRERGMETMLWTASFDYRAGSGTIGSRIALSAPANTYDEGVDLFAAVSNELKTRELDCIPSTRHNSSPEIMCCSFAEWPTTSVFQCSAMGFARTFRAICFPAPRRS